jgi:hypothetical protein
MNNDEARSRRFHSSPLSQHYFIVLSSLYHTYSSIILEQQTAISPSIMPSSDEHGTPSEGMCCLCTMEDITVEDGNYGERSFVFKCHYFAHNHSTNFAILSVEYQSFPSLKWKPSLFELEVVQKLLDEQFHQYVERVKKTDCQAELRRLLDKGPPIYISDDTALPLEEGDTHISKLWFAFDGQERSAKLDGALEGEAREKLWEELKQFIIVEGKEEGDDDN